MFVPKSDASVQLIQGASQLHSAQGVCKLAGEQLGQISRVLQLACKAQHSKWHCSSRRKTGGYASWCAWLHKSSLSDALQVIIYGISGVLIPTGFVDFEDTLDHYLEVILRPGGAELPASFIVEAVNAGEIATVAAAFDDVVAQGYTQQLVALLKQVAACSCAA